jgi:hypothetical protein
MVNRRPNAQCLICSALFYASPSVKRVTCSMSCRTEYYRQIGNLLTGGKSGPENPQWKGGRSLHQGRYWLILQPDHPQADRKGYVREHRLVMEKMIGRLLLPGEVVHHKNHVTTDNRPENLELFASNADHKRTECQQGECWLPNHSHSGSSEILSRKCG